MSWVDNVGHLNGQSLQKWNKGDSLSADGLNSNFAILAERIERTFSEAITPDQAVVDLEMRHAAMVARVERLEDMVQMHARQRNEKEWAPLSHLGALVTLVNEVNRRFEDACRRIDEMHAGKGVEHDDLHRRLQRIEQQPDSATQEDHAALAQDHERLRLKEHMLLAQIIALRAEVSILRDLALGKDRQANRLEFAPMSYVGHLLQRIKALEGRDGGKA